jgi:hypothetical protein
MIEMGKFLDSFKKYLREHKEKNMIDRAIADQEEYEKYLDELKEKILTIIAEVNSEGDLPEFVKKMDVLIIELQQRYPKETLLLEDLQDIQNESFDGLTYVYMELKDDFT